MARHREMGKTKKYSENGQPDAERKKIRNRLSQKAFRHRQAEYIKELESQAQNLSKPDNEQIIELEKENKVLRTQLLEVHAKLESVQATLQSLSGTISGALDLPRKKAKGNDQPASGFPEVNFSGSHQNTCADANSIIPDSFEAAESALNDEHSEQSLITEFELGNHHSTNTENVEIHPVDDDLDFNTYSRIITSTENSPDAPSPQIPNIWTYQYQMGPSAYQRAISAGQDVSFVLAREWTPSSSPFSEHVMVLQKCLKEKWLSMGSAFTSRSDLLNQAVSMVLSMFNSVRRPDAMMWYAKTRFYHIVDLTTWQLQPSQKAFERLHPRYRPTDLQLVGNYPCIIDWIPFASIRDKIILLHSANPCIDEIFCDAVSSYAIEARMSDLVLGAPSLPVYVRVLDLIKAMGIAKGGHFQTQPEIELPAPSAALIFESQQYARLTFKALKMDRGVSNYKIDPVFFGRYPELFDETNGDIMAQGIPLKPKHQTILPRPGALDSATVDVYRNFTDFSINVLWNASIRPW